VIEMAKRNTARGDAAAISRIRATPTNTYPPGENGDGPFTPLAYPKLPRSTGHI